MMTLQAAALGLFGLFGALPAFAAPQDASLDDLVKAIATERDDVDVKVFKDIAAIGTREAMQALLTAYEQVASIYMKRAVLRQLAEFDDVDDAFEPALEKLATVAGEASARELRESAVESLGRSPQHGKTFLALVVESAAEDQLRERALELHIRMGGEGDQTWYQKVFERDFKNTMETLGDGDSKKKDKGRGKKDGKDAEPEKKEIAWPSAKLRALAFKAIVSSMDEQEVEKVFSSDESATVRRAALTELVNRGSKKALGFAEGIVKSTTFMTEDRVLAAEIIAKQKGPDAARDLIDIALSNTTPEALRQRIADLVADMKDDKVDKQIEKLIGKGKVTEQAFAIRAAKNLNDEKLVKKLRKGLKDRDAMVAVATIHNLSSRRDRESVEDMEKLLDKTKDDDVRKAVLQGLSGIYDGENAWIERLVEYTKHEDVDLRNAAINEIARLGRRNQLNLFVERLGHEDWSTRYAALQALESLREPEVVGPIVAQMQDETGRMAREFSETLFRLTGESFGKAPAVWKRWFDDQGSSIELIAESKVDELIAEEEERRLKQITSAEFFGIRIESHRVLFIIDVSGSMNEPLRSRYVGEQGQPRIDVAKERLSAAIKGLEDNALFNIVTFSGGVDEWLEKGIAESNGKSRAEALEYVGRLGAAGGTNLYGSLVAAFEDEDIDTIFVLSDGEPSVGELIDPQLIREAVKEMNATRGVVIHTVAVGGTFSILEWLAEDTGGTHVGLQ